MIVKLPFISPEHPMPATARAMMSILEDVAIPQSNEPSSNTKKNPKKVNYIFLALAHNERYVDKYLRVEIGINLTRQRLQASTEQCLC